MDQHTNKTKSFILALALSLVSSGAYAQVEIEDILSEPDVDGVSHFRKKSEIKTPESAMFFVRVGKSVTTDSKGETSKNGMGSFGHRRLADTLIYGFEYNYHYTPDGIRYQNYDLNIGYRPNLSHKVTPYLIGGFGLTESTKGEDGTSGGSGVNYFVDAGIEMYKIDMGSFHLRTMTGLKVTKEHLTGGKNPNMSFTDVYFGIGFGW